MYAVAEPWLLEAPQVTRDDCWLQRKLDTMWDDHFPDIPRVNTVEVNYARFWKARLGLITFYQESATTYIGINSYLRYREVPDFVNAATLAHEIAHYAHGFGSPLPRKYYHPHRGGVVVKELEARGLGMEHRAHQRWVRDHWHELCEANTKLRAVR